MTYLIVILLTIINVFFEVYKNKKGNQLTKYYLHKYLYNIIALNSIVFILVALTVFFYNKIDIEVHIWEYIIYGIYALSFLLLVLQHEKYKIENKVLENKSYLNILIIIFIISLVIGDRGRVMDTSGILILPTLISSVLLLITAFKNIKIQLVKEKEKEDKKWTYNKKIYINNICYVAVISTIILLLLTENNPISYVAYAAITIITLYIYYRKTKKIKTEQNKLTKSIKENNKIGKEYIFDFQRDIIITRTIIKYIVIALISVVASRFLNESYIIIAVQILIIVLYISLLNKIKLNNVYDSLNKKSIDKDYKKVEDTLLDDIPIKDRLLNIKYDKVIYIKDNNIYKSEELLYNIKKEDLNKIDLYINTVDYNKYIFVVEEIFK